METWGKKWVKQHPIFVRIKETELKQDNFSMKMPFFQCQ